MEKMTFQSTGSMFKKRLASYFLEIWRVVKGSTKLLELSLDGKAFGAGIFIWIFHPFHENARSAFYNPVLAVAHESAWAWLFFLVGLVGLLSVGLCKSLTRSISQVAVGTLWLLFAVLILHARPDRVPYLAWFLCYNALEACFIIFRASMDYKIHKSLVEYRRLQADQRTSQCGTTLA